ncbi:hypothetical protein [Devosia sp.]|uniref:hypothetical protein n=1 Tax=Devosia sp. TaxID=1871048 RepID=UPI001B181602|nr:hypothetical protein [Devosia sp.]MBO9589443.1 hypothetical protein [Devosia sp.]
MTDSTTSGRRFSHLYLAGGDPRSDSSRMRRRLSVACPLTAGLDDHLEAELGVYAGHRQLSSRTRAYLGVAQKFFVEGQLRDVLDAVTLIYHFTKSRDPENAREWREDARRIFAEENVSYSVDEEGGVHYAVDSAFEAVKAGALSSLRGPRYANAAAMFEQGMRALDSTPPDGKGAIRAVFASAEGLFRVMFPSAARLGAAEAEQHIGPELTKLYDGDPTARRAASKLLASFKSWVDGAHFYRHEQGQEEVSQPPLGLAVLLLQEGSGYIRWLAQIDQKHG